MVDDFQLRHQRGPGVETIFYSSYVFVTKLSSAVALGISTLSLESVLEQEQKHKEPGGGKRRSEPLP